MNFRIFVSKRQFGIRHEMTREDEREISAADDEPDYL
jgi:hypothetical protein